MPTNNPPIVEALNKFRAALLRRERAVATRLVQAYGEAYQKLKYDIAALESAIAELGPGATWEQVERLSLYRSLLRQIRDEVNNYAAFAESEIGEGAQAAIETALLNSEELVQLALPGLTRAQVSGLWNRLVPEQVETMLGFLQSDSPLYVNLSKLGADVAALTAEKLRLGIILGYNPRKVARLITQATGQGLTWSLKTARTANLWAYRLASHTSYQANNHVVSGWIWFAQLGDPRTCLSCTNMHGSEHSVDEVLNDHHQGRCTPIPQVVSYRDLGFNIREVRPQYQRGEDWFRGLSAAEQKTIMGAGMWGAWKKHEFEFADLSVPYQDEVYGEMLREASLKGLLGERAKVYYGR